MGRNNNTQPPPILPLQTSDPEAEECYLGTLLVNVEAFYQAGWITPDDFQIERNRWIFEAICRLHENRDGNQVIDVFEAVNELRRMGRLGPELVDEYHLSELSVQPPTYNHAEHYAKRIRAARRLQALAEVTIKAGRLVASQNGIDPVYKVAALLADIDERFPDPESAKAERFSTMRDLESVLGPIGWDWPGWLARGFGTLIAAEPGTGKSMLGLRVAACYLLGWAWPDGTPYTGERGRVLWCETEAGQAMNLQRAHDWGLPVDQIVFPTGNPLDNVSLEDPRHLETIRRLSQQEDVKLIVVDSFSGSHSKDENDTDAGRVIRGVAEIARDNYKPLIITHHLNKGFRSNRITLTNIRGSTAIAQFVRVIWAMDKPDPDKADSIRLYGIKNNLGPLSGDIGLTITASGMQTLIEAPKPPKGETAADRAVEFLLDLLDREPLTTKEVEAAFEAAGLSDASLRRARTKLNILSVKQGSGPYMLSLPARKTDERIN